MRFWRKLKTFLPFWGSSFNFFWDPFWGSWSLFIIPFNEQRFSVTKGSKRLIKMAFNNLNKPNPLCFETFFLNHFCHLLSFLLVKDKGLNSFEELFISNTFCFEHLLFRTLFSFQKLFSFEHFFYGFEHFFHSEYKIPPYVNVNKKSENLPLLNTE